MSWRSRISTMTVTVLFGASLAVAQGSSTTPDRQWGQTGQQSRTDQERNQQQTLTGCLQTGAAANQFILRTESGQTWLLTGRDLESQIGHTVTVTGDVIRQGPENPYSGASGGPDTYGAYPQQGPVGTTNQGRYGAPGSNQSGAPGAYGAPGQSGASGGYGAQNQNNPYDTANQGTAGSGASSQSSAAASAGELNVNRVVVVSNTCESSGSGSEQKQGGYRNSR